MVSITEVCKVLTKPCTFELRMRQLQYAATTDDRENQNGRSIREMSSEMGDNHGTFDLFRLDSSVRRKNRKCAEVT